MQHVERINDKNFIVGYLKRLVKKGNSIVCIVDSYSNGAVIVYEDNCIDCSKQKISTVNTEYAE